MLNNNSVSPLVHSQAPEFVQENYPQFLNFVQAYYEFMENGATSPQNILQNKLDYIDIDSTLDQFLPLFARTYPSALPSNIAVNRRLLSKALIQLYQTKGSVTSYELLFN